MEACTGQAAKAAVSVVVADAAGRPMAADGVGSILRAAAMRVATTSSVLQVSSKLLESKKFTIILLIQMNPNK